MDPTKISAGARKIIMDTRPWQLDPVKYGDDPRRCEAYKRNRLPNGERVRCKCPKSCGERFCHFHLRRRKRRSVLGQLGSSRSAASRVLKGLPLVYSQHLSASLANKVAEARALDPYDLSEELALLKVTAVDTAQMYDAVVLATDMNASLKAEDKLSAKCAAGAMLRGTLAEVFDATKRMAEVESQRKDMLSATSLSSVLARVVTAVHAVLGDDREEEVMAIASEIKKIKLPSQSIDGTDITPDADAIEMDASVPDQP